jgi:hypothetical protein
VLAGVSGRLALRPVQVRIARQHTYRLTFARVCRMNLLPVVHMLVALAENAAVANLLVVFPGTSMACSRAPLIPCPPRRSSVLHRRSAFSAGVGGAAAGVPAAAAVHRHGGRSGVLLLQIPE